MISVQEVVANKHLIPRGDEVDVNIVCDLEVTVHSKETRERTVDGIVESDTIKTVERRATEEELVVGRREVGCRKETTRRELCRSTTTTTISRR